MKCSRLRLTDKLSKTRQVTNRPCAAPSLDCHNVIVFILSAAPTLTANTVGGKSSCCHLATDIQAATNDPIQPCLVIVPFVMPGLGRIYYCAFLIL